MTLVKAERRLGCKSRLVTLAHDDRDYEEDICLDLPFLDFWGTRFAKNLFSHPSKLDVSSERIQFPEIPIKWHPNGFPEKHLVAFREWVWQPKIQRLFNEIDFWNFDVYQLDGGLEFFRDGRIIRQLKKQGKKIICCYTGSDLRTRGVIPEIDAVSDLNISFEFDHLKLHPNIKHVFFPFDVAGFPQRSEEPSGNIKIGHAPTNRRAKGSDIITAVIEELKTEFSFEFLLIENIPYREALHKKSQCHIFIDQISELGYGINALESLAMGIPTCSSLAPDFVNTCPDHPFIDINKNNLKHKLRELVQNTRLRQVKGCAGREWVDCHHNSVKVVEEIHKLADFELSAAYISELN